ncbi:hypothetical protein BaRGS_00022934, partial [Batillaria attramentaria]
MQSLTLLLFEIRSGQKPDAWPIEPRASPDPLPFRSRDIYGSWDWNRVDVSAQ